MSITPASSWLSESIQRHVRCSLAKDWSDVSNDDLFHAVCLAVKDVAAERLLATERRYRDQDVKRVYYLSMEFLVGRTLENNLLNLGLLEECKTVLISMGRSPEAIFEEEPDPALGNGGLGRLASCFLDSMATLGIPGFGYGINYQFGLFRQTIENGYQRERPDRWMSDGHYWQIARADKAVDIPLYGRVETRTDLLGRSQPFWVDTQTIYGVPHDMPIIGHGGNTVNFLRLYSAQTSNDFDVSIFNQGDYMKAVEDKIRSETISKVLYPGDAVSAGKELRLLQEYFFVACALRDIFRRYLRHHEGFEGFPSKVAIQMNDTHPAIAVAELMRLLVDEYQQPWESAWKTTVDVLSYTNHTLLAEALERWPVPLFERVLPRHLQIIYEINRRLLETVSKDVSTPAPTVEACSIVEEGPTKHIRMANLAVVGSHSVNGVAALHSDLVKRQLLPQFHALWPERFNNKTNGVTPRRWLAKCNPGLAQFLTEAVGPGWMTNLDVLKGLESRVDDRNTLDRIGEIKEANKKRLAAFLRKSEGVFINPRTLFDIQAKRIHLYKRQLLNILRVAGAYFHLVEYRKPPPVPVTFLFSGKAAPGYWEAKQVIKLIHCVARVVNQDPRSRDWMTVVFVPDYRVSVAELLIPAADLSEQISTAGYEASGTGNMKFALNGALTIGTYDGATVEMAERVGADNMFLFGLRVPEAQRLKARGYRPLDIVAQIPELHQLLEAVRRNRFNPQEPGLFEGLIGQLMSAEDPFLHLADYLPYEKAHKMACETYADHSTWNRKALLTIARMSYFSSDRAIRDYATEIWNVSPAA